MIKFAKIKQVAVNAGAICFYAGLAWWALPHVGRALSLGPATVREVPRTEESFLGMCQRTIVQEIESPEKGYVATLSHADCGATTGWVSSISVFNKQTRKMHHGLLGLQGRPDAHRIQWSDERTLIASGFLAGDVTQLSHSSVVGIRVVLNPLPPTGTRPSSATKSGDASQETPSK